MDLSEQVHTKLTFFVGGTSYGRDLYRESYYYYYYYYYSMLYDERSH